MQNKVDDFIDSLYQKDNIIALTPREVECYKKEWFNQFVPINKQEIALNCYCFDSDGYNGYLWHIFSYDILNCLVGETAMNRFSSLEKGEAILLFSIINKAYKIKDTSQFKAIDYQIFDDIILTAHDFSWTYVKTHEETCGPYFYIVS